jgi:hypothetical protein
MVVKKGTKMQDEQAKEIRQEIKMTVDERQRMANRIKREYYGKYLPDIRDY